MNRSELCITAFNDAILKLQSLPYLHFFLSKFNQLEIRRAETPLFSTNSYKKKIGLIFWAVFNDKNVL